MLEELIGQDELDEVAPLIVEALELFISEEIKQPNELVAYALAELLNKKINELDLEPEMKGGVISAIISGLVDMNEETLAIHNEWFKTLLDKKASTVH